MILLWTVCAIFTVNSFIILKRSEKILAVVVSVRKFGLGSSERIFEYCPKFEFINANGRREQRTTELCARNLNYSIGSEVWVLLDPKLSGHVRLNNFRGLWLGPFYTFIFAYAFTWTVATYGPS